MSTTMNTLSDKVNKKKIKRFLDLKKWKFYTTRSDFQEMMQRVLQAKINL